MESHTVKDEFDLIERRQRISSTSFDSDDTHCSQLGILTIQQDLKKAEACKSISLRRMESLVASISDDYLKKSESIDSMYSPVEATGVDSTFTPGKDDDNYFHGFDVEDVEHIKNKNRKTFALLGSFKSEDGCASLDSTELVDSTSLVPNPNSQATGKQFNSCPIEKRFISCTYLINKENCHASRCLKKSFTAQQTSKHPENIPIASGEDKIPSCSAKNKLSDSLQLRQKYDHKQVAACLSKLRLKINLPISSYRSLSDLFIVKAKYLELPYLHGFQRIVVLHSDVTTGKKCDIYYNPANDNIKLCSQQDVNKYFDDHPDLASKLSTRNFDFTRAQHNVGLPYEIVRPALAMQVKQRQAIKAEIPVDASCFAGLFDDSNSEVDFVGFQMMESISSDQFLLNNCKVAKEESGDTATPEANVTNKINDAFSQRSQSSMEKRSSDLTKPSFGSIFTVEEEEHARQLQSLKRKSAILVELFAENTPKKMKTSSEITTLSQRDCISVDLLQPLPLMERSKALFECTITPEKENTSDDVVPHSISRAEQQFEAACVELDNGGCHNVLANCETPFRTIKMEVDIPTESQRPIMYCNLELELVKTDDHYSSCSSPKLQTMKAKHTEDGKAQAHPTSEMQAMKAEHTDDGSARLYCPPRGDGHEASLVYESIPSGESFPFSDVNEDEEEEIDLLNVTTSPSKYSEAIRGNVSYSEQCHYERTLLDQQDYAPTQKNNYLPRNVKDEPSVEDDQGYVSSRGHPHHWPSCSLPPLPPCQMVGVQGPNASLRSLVPADGHEHQPTENDATSSNSSFQINVKDDLPDRSLSPRFAVSFSGRPMWMLELLGQQREQRAPSFSPVMPLDLSTTRPPSVSSRSSCPTRMTNCHVRDNSGNDHPDPSSYLSPPPDDLSSLHYRLAAAPDRLDLYNPVPAPSIGEVMHDSAGVVAAELPSSHHQYSLARTPDRLNIYNPAPCIGEVMHDSPGVVAAELPSSHHQYSLARTPDRLNIYNPAPYIGEVMHDSAVVVPAGLPSSHHQYSLVGAPDRLNIYNPLPAPSIGEVMHDSAVVVPAGLPSSHHQYSLARTPDRLNIYNPAPCIGEVMHDSAVVVPAGLPSSHHQYSLARTPDRLNIYNPVPYIGEVMHDSAVVVPAGLPSSHHQYSLVGAPDRLNMYNPLPAPSIGELMHALGTAVPAWMPPAHHQHPLAGAPDRLNIYNPTLLANIFQSFVNLELARGAGVSARLTHAGRGLPYARPPYLMTAGGQ